MLGVLVATARSRPLCQQRPISRLASCRCPEGRDRTRITFKTPVLMSGIMALIYVEPDESPDIISAGTGEQALDLLVTVCGQANRGLGDQYRRPAERPDLLDGSPENG